MPRYRIDITDTSEQERIRTRLEEEMKIIGDQTEEQMQTKKIKWMKKAAQKMGDMDFDILFTHEWKTETRLEFVYQALVPMKEGYYDKHFKKLKTVGGVEMMRLDEEGNVVKQL